MITVMGPMTGAVHDSEAGTLTLTFGDTNFVAPDEPYRTLHELVIPVPKGLLPKDKTVKVRPDAPSSHA